MHKPLLLESTVSGSGMVFLPERIITLSCSEEDYECVSISAHYHHIANFTLVCCNFSIPAPDNPSELAHGRHGMLRHRHIMA